MDPAAIAEQISQLRHEVQQQTAAETQQALAVQNEQMQRAMAEQRQLLEQAHAALRAEVVSRVQAAGPGAAGGGVAQRGDDRGAGDRSVIRASFKTPAPEPFSGMPGTIPPFLWMQQIKHHLSLMAHQIPADASTHIDIAGARMKGTAAQWFHNQWRPSHGNVGWEEFERDFKAMFQPLGGEMTARHAIASLFQGTKAFS